MDKRVLRTQGDSVTIKSPPRRREHERYYVYRLLDPRNNRVFYVGKGQGKRAWSHQSRVLLGNSPDGNSAKANVIVGIVEAGLSVVVEIVSYFGDADDALDLEYRLIRDTPHLTNDRRGYNNGAQVEARLTRLQEAKRLRMERRFREAEMIRSRMEQVWRVTRSPRAIAEAERWITREVRDHLIQAKAQREAKERRL